MDCMLLSKPQRKEWSNMTNFWHLFPHSQFHMRGMKSNYNMSFILRTEAICYVQHILSFFFSTPTLERKPKQWIWFKDKPGFMFALSALVFEILLVAWVDPAACFPASMGPGSCILAVLWRHQSKGWTRCKSGAFGRFVVSYITYRTAAPLV